MPNRATQLNRLDEATSFGNLWAEGRNWLWNSPVPEEEMAHRWEIVLERYAGHPVHHLELAPQLQENVAEWLMNVLC